jgi:hypothetical protein
MSNEAEATGASPLRLIGYWHGEQCPQWPNVLDFVDAQWDEDDRHATWQYVLQGTVVRVWMGWSYCRICGVQNGDADLTDGIYLWPEGLAHYVQEHDVRLPDEFVRHARSRLDALEATEVDTSWWQSQPAPGSGSC